METKQLPVGISDFKDVVTGNYYYVDKTLLIKDIMDKGDKILLIPRPRRFGKTLNLSMLKYFYDCCPAEAGETKKLFDSLAICKTSQKYLDKMSKYPVIFFTFKNIKELTWETCLLKLKQLIQQEYSRHDYLLESPKIKSHERNYFQKVMNLKGHIGDYENSLEKLLIFLNRYYGERVVILIDEYDAPIHAGFNYGYYDEIINFIRNFLCGGLKDTDQYLEKGILTGIMRIAKESIFSGLNNPGVYTLLSEEFDDKFGFTEQEVEILLKDFQVLDMYDQVQTWYNGYRFGKRTIYNPWSIINFLGSKGKELEPYWLNTSDNKIVESLISSGGKELKEELEQLIRGETIEKAIEQDIVLKALLEGDIDVFEEIFYDYVIKAMSFFDTAGEPEKVYHAFVMGLFLWLSLAYLVKSNRESGYGRYDIMIIPEDKNKLGFIIEFKTVRKKETLEAAVKSALEQIDNQKYETELLQRGIKNYKKLAIIFKGKEVIIKQ